MINISIDEYFERESDKLDNYFHKFQNLKDKDLIEAGSYFNKFKQGLQDYIVKEEKIIFPLFEKKTLGKAKAGPTYVMRSEHAQILQLLDSINNKLQNKHIDTAVDEEKLTSILVNHRVKEGSFLYPAIDKIINEEEKEEILKKINNIP